MINRFLRYVYLSIFIVFSISSLHAEASLKSKQQDYLTKKIEKKGRIPVIVALDMPWSPNLSQMTIKSKDEQKKLINKISFLEKFPQPKRLNLKNISIYLL